MENRLKEIKALFEKEQVKREKEALIWSSAGDGKRRKAQIDAQSRKILGKGVHTLTSPPDGKAKPKFKVLKDEPLQLPKRPKNLELANFIENQRSRMEATNRRKTPKSKGANRRDNREALVPSISPPAVPPPAEDYALLSDITGSEIFELPLTAQGHLSLQVVRSVSSSRTVGIYTNRDGRKRLMLANEDGFILRPSGGWTGVTFYPLVPPRSSRPSTADTTNAARRPLDASPATPQMYPSSPHHIVSPHQMMTPTPPKTPRGGALLSGAYDEDKAAQEFKAAVMEFRSGQTQSNPTKESRVSEVTNTDETESQRLEERLNKIGQMFENRSNLTAMERILLQRKNENNEEALEADEHNDTEPTEEELEIEEERNRFREMLIGGDEVTPEDHWAVPPQWTESMAAGFQHQNVQQPTGVSLSMESAEPMWFPTPQIVMQEQFESQHNENINIDNTQHEYYEPAGEVYQEHIRTVYNDGTIVSNLITVETGGGDDSGSDGVDCRQSPGGDMAGDWMGYASDDNLDLGNDADFKREAMRIIDEHARRYQEQQGSDPAGAGQNRPDSASGVRPASRASVMTDAALADDRDMTSQLNEMELKYYPQDEYD